MKQEKIENKIRKATLKKDYEESKRIILACYKNHFKKMIKYKRGKIDKTWYFHDYLDKIKELYRGIYKYDIEEMQDVLYTNKYDIKEQISWLIENSHIFNDYKL